MSPPELTAPMHVQHNNGGVAELDGLLYVWSGYSGSDRTRVTEVYDPATGQWQQKADMPVNTECDGPAEFALNGLIYSVGGEGPWSGHFTDNVLGYDPMANTWTQLNPFPVPCWDMMAAVCSGDAYVFGGRHGYGPTYPECREFVPATGQWEQKTPMPYSVMRAGVAVIDNKIWVFGGNHKPSEPQNESTRHIQIYDPNTNSWEFRQDAIPWLLWQIQAVYHDGEVYLFAADVYENGDWVPNEAVYVYNPATDCWHTAAFAPPVPAHYGSPVGLLNGQAYFTNNSGAAAFRVPLARARRLGDLNCDNDVNFDDINAFVLALGGESNFYTAYPECNWFNGDTNGDSTVNFDDINLFITVLAG